MDNTNSIEPQSPKSGKKIVWWLLGIMVAVLAVLGIFIKVFNITIYFNTNSLGYTLFPQSVDKKLPALLAPNILLEVAEPGKNKDWNLQIRLLEFPSPHTQKDIDKVEFALLQNFCSTPAPFRTPYAIHHEFYGEHHTELFRFTIVPGQCQEVLSKDYVNKYYSSIFEEVLSENVANSATKLPLYASEYLAIRHISFAPENKQLTTEYTVFPQDPPVALDYEQQKKSFTQAVCARMLDHVFSMSGYTFSLVYYNPQGEKLHSTVIPAYSC